MSRAGAGQWTESGAFQVAMGIHRIPLPMRDDGLRAVNVYAMEDYDGIALIDGGWAIPEARDVLADGLAAIGYRPQHIRRILVTHAHIDHYTLAVWLRSEFGAKVAIGHGEKESLRWITGSEPRHLHQAARLDAAGAPELAQYISSDDGTFDSRAEGWELPDQWLKNSTFEVGGRVLRAIETPGHTRGHMVFWSEADGVMFTGDQILPHITPSIGFESVPQEQPLVAFLDSISMVRQLPDALMLPAHGPADRQVHQRIDELIEHHRLRLDQTFAVVEKLGDVTALEVAKHLAWTRHERQYTDLDDFNSTLAVNETYAHLTYLVAFGRLTVAGTVPGIFSVTEP